MSRLNPLALLLLVAAPLTAQQPAAATQLPVADTSIFAPLTLPTATMVRNAAGAPGARYWQNRADYDLAGTLDTASKTLRGQLTLRYTNHSPDTLHYVWLQTEQNAFKANSLNSYIFPQDSRFGARGFEGGDVFDRFDQLVATSAKGPVTHVAVARRNNGTKSTGFGAEIYTSRNPETTTGPTLRDRRSCPVEYA